MALRMGFKPLTGDSSPDGFADPGSNPIPGLKKKTAPQFTREIKVDEA